MRKAIERILVLGVLFTAAAAYSQVSRSVTGGTSSLWAGGEYANFSPDYGGGHINGLGAIFDFDFTPKIGVIGEARWLRWNGNGDEHQSDYLVGAKYRLYRIHRLSLNAKFVLGGVWIKYPYDIGTGSYFAYAPGATADYRLSSHFLVRGSYEYQFLPSAPDIPPYPSNGLTPHGFTVGVEYRVF